MLLERQRIQGPEDNSGEPSPHIAPLLPDFWPPNFHADPNNAPPQISKYAVRGWPCLSGPLLWDFQKPFLVEE